MAYNFYKNITTVNRTVKNSRNIKYIVLHYTGNNTDTALSNSKYFKSVNRGASAHYFVDQTDVCQVVEDKDVAWSVGKRYSLHSLFGTVTNANSLNIEMCGTNGEIAEETIQNAVALTKELMVKYDVPIQNVIRHYDAAGKKCPGFTGWIPNDESKWNRFKSLVEGESSVTTPLNSNQIFRVRKSWNDIKSQVGAYSNLENAKKNCPSGYNVYDESGNVVYPVSAPAPTAAPSPTPTPSTSKVNGNELVRIGQQHAVNFTGVKIAVDGLAGAETKKMKARVLQHAMNLDYKAKLVEDGSFGAASKKALGKHYVKKGEKQYMVTALEILLYLNGVNANGVECPGNFGSGLESAVKEYQRTHGLTVDGMAGSKTFLSLVS